MIEKILNGINYVHTKCICRHLSTTYICISLIWNAIAEVHMYQKRSLQPRQEPEACLPSIQRRYNPVLYNELATQCLVVLGFFGGVNFMQDYFGITNTPNNRLIGIAAFNLFISIFGPCKMLATKASLRIHLKRVIEGLAPDQDYNIYQ